MKPVTLKTIAAGLFGLAIATAAHAETVPPGLSGKPVVEVAFALDATGSMASLIDGAKRKIWSIATTIADANPDAEVRMALVAYRDIGDEFVTKTFDLTTDIQSIYGHLLALKAAGGGDWPESVNEALDNTVTKLSWTQGPRVDRIVFLVGDAPPHMDYKQDRKYPEVLADAKARGIVVNAVQAGEARDTARIWRDIAQMGGGRYIPIPQDGGKIVIIETPYDEEIIILQRAINETIIPYGEERVQQRTRDKAAQVTAAPKSSASDLAGYVNRRASKGEAITGEGDLVADIKQGRKALKDIPVHELPKPMQAMTEADRAAHVQKLEAKRAELTQKMTALVTKREAFTAEKKAEQMKAGGKANGFDAVVSEALKAQIRK